MLVILNIQIDFCAVYHESLPCKMASLRKVSIKLEKQQILQFSNTILKFLHALKLENKIISEEFKSIL